MSIVRWNLKEADDETLEVTNRNLIEGQRHWVTRLGTGKPDSYTEMARVDQA